MEDQEYSTRGRVRSSAAYQPYQFSFSLGDASSTSLLSSQPRPSSQQWSSLDNGESTQHPVVTANELHAGMPTTQCKFVLVNPKDAPPKPYKPRDEEEKENTRAVKAAGGACVFCRLGRRGCSPTRPCTQCTKTHRPCLKDSSLCLANPTRNNTQFQLSDGIFGKAQTTLKYFRDGYIEDLLKGNGTVSVDWEKSNGINPSTWSERLDQLHSGEIDDSVRNSLVDIALKGISIPQLEQTEHFEPLYDDPLYKNAYVMFKLFAAIETISRSQLTIQPVHALTSRYVMFLILTIYTMKLSEVSLSFVSCLQGAIRDNRLGEYQVQWAVEIYRQLIKRLGSFQKLDSFLSDLFCHIQPRLTEIQPGVDKIRSALPREQHIVFPSISEVQPFRIAIRITSGGSPLIVPAASRLDLNSDGFVYGMDELLHRPFDLSLDVGPRDTNLELCPGEGTIDPRMLSMQDFIPRYEVASTCTSTGEGTIDPRVLSMQDYIPRYEVASTRTSTIAADNVFSAPGGSQETDATLMHSHNSVPSTHLEFNSDAYQDLLHIGSSFS